MCTQEDDRRTYFLVGVVYRTLFKEYQRRGNSRVINVMKSQFISRKEAIRAKLPVSEVDVKYVLCFFSFSTYVSISCRVCACVCARLYHVVCVRTSCCRSYNRLLYANRRTWTHFKAIRNRYYAKTHDAGRVYCKDARVMRNTSEVLLCDERLKTLFQELPEGCAYPEDDLHEVYVKYVTRAEGLIANDLKSALNETLHAKYDNKRKSGKPQKLEQLRSVKRKKTTAKRLSTDDTTWMHILN